MNGRYLPTALHFHLQLIDIYITVNVLIRPFPIANFRHILPILVYVLFVIN